MYVYEYGQFALGWMDVNHGGVIGFPAVLLPYLPLHDSNREVKTEPCFFVLTTLDRLDPFSTLVKLPPVVPRKKCPC